MNKTIFYKYNLAVAAALDAAKASSKPIENEDLINSLTKTIDSTMAQQTVALGVLAQQMRMIK